MELDLFRLFSRSPPMTISVQKANDLGHELWHSLGKGRGVVQKLLAAGANPNWRGDFERTVFMQAARCDCAELFPLLIGAGADPLASTARENALSIACSNGSTKSAIALATLFPLSMWTPPPVKIKRKTHALNAGHLLADALHNDGHSETILALLPFFVEQGLLAPVGASLAERRGRLRGFDGGNPFMMAAASGNVDCVLALAPYFDPNEADAQGRTALMMAANSIEGSNGGQSGAFTPALLEAMLSVGCDPKAASAEGETVLMAAAKRAKIQWIKILLPLSDALAADSAGRTALMAAVRPDFVGTLHQNSGDGLRCLKLLLPRSDANAVDAEGRTALALAMEDDFTEKAVIEALAAATDPSQKNAAQRSPFAEASASKNWVAAEALAASATSQEIEQTLLALAVDIGPSMRSRVEGLLLREVARSAPAQDDAPPRKPKTRRV
jgi:hypothetical protein